MNVGLKEFSISPNIHAIPAGQVTFDVTNDGTTPHEMVLIKSGDAPSKLPFKDGKASEQGSVGEVSDLGVGRSDTLTVRLDPGKYVMICNLPGHYQAGMRTEFTVA